MRRRYAAVPADQLQPGDHCAHDLDGDRPYTVLGSHEPCQDPFGRAMIRYWCRMLDGSDREGWKMFGPAGFALRETRGTSNAL